VVEGIAAEGLRRLDVDVRPRTLEVEVLGAVGDAVDRADVTNRHVLAANGRECIPRTLLHDHNGRAVGGERHDHDAAFYTLFEGYDELDRLPMPFERARTLLLLGQLQRRQRRKESAAASLQEATEIFERLHVPLWADRAHSELARANVAQRRSGQLTPSEQRVAELAASGMKNRDVATTLFISPKTVEANLARIYRKLGIKSRAELGRHMSTT